MPDVPTWNSMPELPCVTPKFANGLCQKGAALLSAYCQAKLAAAKRGRLIISLGTGALLWPDGAEYLRMIKYRNRGMKR
jgi:hypothetical protein